MNTAQQTHRKDRKRSSFLWLILAILLSMQAACTPARAQETCKGIPVGVMIAGSEMDEAQEQKDGYELALKEINSAGGVQGCPLRLVYNASDGRDASPDKVQAGLLDLTEQGVMAVLGATTNDGSKHLSAIAGYTGTPVLITADTADDLQYNTSAWVFHLNPTNKAYASAVFDMVNNRYFGTAGVAVLYEHTEFGESAAVTAGKAALDRGLNILIYQGYAPSTKDYSASLQAVAASHADVVYIINSYPEQAQAILKTIREENLAFGMLIGSGAGFTARSFLYDGSGSINADLGNLIIPMAWSRELPWKDAAGFETALREQQQAGDSPTAAPVGVRSVQAYSGLWIMAEAMQAVAPRSAEQWNQTFSNPDLASAYRGELADALRGFRASQHASLLGPVEFDTTGQNKVEGVLIQARDGRFTTIYPAQYAEGQ